MRKAFFYQSLIILIITTSCFDSSDPTTPTLIRENYKNGIIVTNEGSYLGNNASISFFNTTTINVTNYAYSTVNREAKLGDVLQSAHYVDDQLYLIVNNSDKIVITNETLEHVASIENLAKPRYMTSKNGKGYVTETVEYGQKGQLSILDLENQVVTKTVAMDDQPEAMIISGEYLFISNQASNNVFVMSIITEAVVDTIQVGVYPGGMVTDKDGDIWVICTGSFSEENDATFYEIDASTFDVKSNVAIGLDPGEKIAIDNAGEVIYFYEGKSIYRFDTSNPVAPSSAWITESQATGFYGIGFSPDNLVYMADAGDYVEPGNVFFYNLNGVPVSMFIAGLGTNGFIFR